MGSCADARHPLSQCRNGDLAADNDDGNERNRDSWISLDEQYEKDGDHELVGDRVEKLAEFRCLSQLPGDISVQYVGDRSEPEDDARDGPRKIHRAVEANDDDRDRCDANQGQGIGEVNSQESVRHSRALITVEMQIVVNSLSQRAADAVYFDEVVDTRSTHTL